MEFKDRLKQLRQERAMTQEQLAHALDIPPATIRRLETAADSLPRKERLQNIADFFSVQIDYLVGRTNDRISIDKNYSNINVAYFGGAKEELTEEEAARLKEELEMFRLLKEKKMREKDNNKA
ncbi:helix-turn-helix domain-containing protein [Paenibacillus sp. LMG 31456]|uniref:Helix-turn-helix domain-containing protein n=1 Tax=Paenibacillus foliorum TaxID=2654974 RepID=A0A972GRX6_9BACL|nr:helix-turn-helix transcriptional regulator [Paenibacillus foliorum]NOU95622.1 helix-turn-helix domain-containing protein [Paenibacillus foliorum]